MSLLTTWTPLRSLAGNTSRIGGLASPTYTGTNAATALSALLADCPAHLIAPLTDRVAVIMGTSDECAAVSGWNPEVLDDWSGMFAPIGGGVGRVWIDLGTYSGSTLLHEWGHAVDHLGAGARMSTAEPWTTWWAATAGIRTTYAYRGYYGWTNAQEFFAELFRYHWLTRSPRLTASERAAAGLSFDALLSDTASQVNLYLPAAVHAWLDALVIAPPPLG